MQFYCQLSVEQHSSLITISVFADWWDQAVGTHVNKRDNCTNFWQPIPPWPVQRFYQVSSIMNDYKKCRTHVQVPSPNTCKNQRMKQVKDKLEQGMQKSMTMERSKVGNGKKESIAQTNPSHGPILLKAVDQLLN